MLDILTAIAADWILEEIVRLLSLNMIEITIQIKEVIAGTQKAIDVGLTTKKANETPIERGLQDRILPAVKDLLKDSGLLGKSAS